MKNLFFMGGPLFMSILTLLLLCLVSWVIYHLSIYIKAPGAEKAERALEKLSYSRSIGLFALVTGILGQLLGFYDAFAAMETAPDISPAMLFGGIKISMISTLYGMIIYLLSILLWFGINAFTQRKTTAA